MKIAGSVLAFMKIVTMFFVVVILYTYIIISVDK